MLDTSAEDREFRSAAIDGAVGLGLFLLGHFAATDGAEVLGLPHGAQRLIAFLALHPQGVRCDFAAGSLWPEVGERQAHACLRQALRRMNGASPFLCADASDVSLAGGVVVDLVAAKDLARRMIADAVEPDAVGSALGVLSSVLLPGWYEDWTILEAENWRQLRMHALESGAALQASCGRFGEAVGLAAAAVGADPLRESARACVMRVHLAEGNQSEAVREFDRYRALLAGELGLEPTVQLRALLPG